MTAAAAKDASYEAQREANIKRNAERMSAMGVDALAAAVRPQKTRKRVTSATKETKRGAAPTRTSSRATKTIARYADIDDAAFERALATGSARATTSGRARYAPEPPRARDASASNAVASTFADHIDRRERRDTKGTIIPPDVSFRVTRHKTKGTLVFADHPEFTPTLTPAQVIAAGAFGGCYFHPRGGKPGVKGPCDITPREFPRQWFDGLDVSRYASRRYDPETNFYRVKSGQDQAYWERRGWIDPRDPRGWFQWYCRFFCGRRTEDDARQISRWTGVCGAKGRWKTNLLRKVVHANARYDDARVSPVIRQTLLHWACEIREDEASSMSKKM